MQVSSHKISGREVYNRLLTYAMPHWLLFLFGIIGTIIASCVDASLTWSLKPLLDKAFIARDELFIDWLPIMVIIIFVLRGLSNFSSQYFITLVGRNIVLKLRQELFEHLLKLPARYLDQSTSGQLISTLIFNVEQVNKASSDALIILVRESFFIVGVLVVMITTSWQLSLLFFLTAPLIAYIARKSSKKMRRFGQYLQTGMGNITHIAEEAIEGYRVIKTFGGEAYENAKFVQATLDNRRREMQMIATESMSSPLVQLTIAGVIAVTVYLATQSAGHVTAGGFASILACMLAILKPLKNITTVNNAIQRGIVGAESIFALLDEQPELDVGQLSLQRAKGAIRFENVSFTYEKGQQEVLKNITFEVKPGQVIALVGKSGSGKSTLVNLLPRFYNHYSGKIYLDHMDIQNIKLSDLRQQFALVSQHVTLFNDTVLHNIAYGQFSKASKDEVIAAAKAANALEFIENLPEQFNTLIGENGLMLSGGQRQRIALARAIIKNAPLLILDEATSALDTESERKIQSALEQLMKTRTTLVIAHRLSTIEKADLILVLNDGKIVEMGNHQALLAQQGEYAKLHAMQFREVENILK